MGRRRAAPATSTRPEPAGVSPDKPRGPRGTWGKRRACLTGVRRGGRSREGRPPDPQAFLSSWPPLLHLGCSRRSRKQKKKARFQMSPFPRSSVLWSEPPSQVAVKQASRVEPRPPRPSRQWQLVPASRRERPFEGRTGLLFRVN